MKKQETAREMDSWLECRAFAPTWECRRKGKKEMEKRSGGEILGHCFDREAALSMYLVEEVFGKVKCPQPDIVFKVNGSAVDPFSSLPLVTSSSLLGAVPRLPRRVRSGRPEADELQGPEVPKPV